MGGKTKQSQRTKNNARPSSSGRSAELLHNAVNLDTSMVAGGNKLMTSLFPTLNTPNLDQALPQEFSMCIKKLNKKDPITKVKALQELTELVNNSKVDDVALVLPSWAHFYKTLTLDSDCKVREATQVCHGALVRVAGRRLAPLLRLVVPAWLQAQHDDHAPATAHAQLSLKTTFPEHKLPEVISFCKAEVMTHITDNLLGNAEKTLTKRVEDGEERALVMQRCAAGALRCLRVLGELLPAAHDEWLGEQLAALLPHAAFWKYATHDSLVLRAAWFEAMSQLVRRCPSALDDKYGARLVRLLAAGGTAAQPPVTAALWGTALQLMHARPDWHQWLDKKEQFSKRILDMLEKGGWGDAKHLTDLLLPLLAYLPKDILTKEFYEAFFYAFFSGLRTKSILNSKSERQYWITSLAECLRYLSIQQNDYVVEVTTSVHRLWLRTALFAEYNQIRISLIKTSATSMASLVKFWLKQSREGNGDKYDQLVRNFWQNVCASLLLQIEKPAAEDLAHIIEGHILLLQSLKTGFLSEAKKVQSIKFDDDLPKEQETQPVTCQVVDPASVERYKHNLNEIVEKICCAYFEYADKNDVAEPILEPLITIFNEFDNKELYVALGKAFGANGVYEFYDKVLAKWLRTDTMRCKAVVDIVFMLLTYLTEEEQTVVMNSFDNRAGGPGAWVLQHAVGHRQWGTAAVRRWLRGHGARDTLLALARAPPATALLPALNHDHQHEMLISETTASEIAEVVGEVVTKALAGEGQVELEAAAGLGAQLATALAAAQPQDGYLALVHCLLRVLLQVPRAAGRLSGPLWCEVVSSVQDALWALPPAARAAQRAAAAAALHQRLAQRTDKVVLSEIDHMASLCPYLLKENDSEPPTDLTEIVEFTQQLFNFEENTSTPIEVFALRHDIVTNKLNCLFDDDNDIIKAIVKDSGNNDPETLTIENLVPYLNKLLFRALYMHKMFLHKVNCDDDEDEEPAKTWCEALLTNNYLKIEFCKVIREFMVTRTLEEGYGFWMHHDVIKEANSRLGTVIDEILAEASQDVRSDMFELVSERGVAEGYYWAHARQYLAERGPQRQDDGPTLDTTNVDDVITGNGYFHCMQVGSEEGEEVARCRVAVMTRSVLAAFPHADPARDVARTALHACQHLDLDPIVRFYHNTQSRIFHERDVAAMPWKEAVAEASVLWALEAVLRLRGWDAGAQHWDLATLATCAALKNLSRQPLSCTKACVILQAALGLYSLVHQFVSAVPAESTRRQPSAHVAALPAEWADVFAPALYTHIYELALHLLESSSLTLSDMMARNIASVWGVLPTAQWSLVPRPEPALTPRGLLRAAGRVLAARAHPACYVLAHRLLRAIEPALVSADEATLSAWEEADGDDAGEGRRLRAALAPHLLRDQCTAALDRALQVTEETCEPDPGSEEYSQLLSVLLLSDALGELMGAAIGDLAQQYIMSYREAEYVSRLAPLSLRLVPGWLLAAAPAPPAPAHWFTAAPPYAPDDGRWRGSLGWLGCRALVCCAELGGGELRAVSVGGGLGRLLSSHVSPALLARQRRRIHDHAQELHALHTQVRVLVSQEVHATCSAVEPRAELWLRLAPTHPLSPPSVRLRAAPAPHLAALLLKYMTHQNGSLLGGVLLWARTMTREEDEEDICHVCYCHRHPTSGRQPDHSCPQCQHHYHHRCLRTWFATSQRTACPLCRTSF